MVATLAGLLVIGVYACVAISAAIICPSKEAGISLGLGVCRLEFWLDRYQSLVAGSLAIIAAVIAATPVREQVRISREQSVVSVLPLLRDEISARVKEDEILANISIILMEIERHAKNIRAPNNAMSAVFKLGMSESNIIIKKTENLERALREHVTRYPLGMRIDDIRRQPGHLIKAAGSLFDLFNLPRETLASIQYANATQIVDERVEEFNRRIQGHVSTVREALRQAEEESFTIKRQLQDALSRASRRIRVAS
ncbi:hypothetical protein [Chelatococcus sambhunathii]|uniref:hypothetical protein n=1 Tax=Chelatococcus sambhunathii TaxID=363953 RepID=UPI001146CD23|nr:hypothetical protein [Chelatococcus sambhunathii]